MTLPTDRWQKETYFLKGDTMTPPKTTKAEADELTARHTPEPWKLVSLGECHWGENCRGHVDIEGADGTTVNDIPYPVDSLNAPRIVATINACRGMADPEAEIARLRADKADILEIGRALSKENRHLRQDKAELVERGEKARLALRRAEEFLDNTNYTNPPDPPLLCHFCKTSEYSGQEGVIHKDNCLITELRTALANARKGS